MIVVAFVAWLFFVVAAAQVANAKGLSGCGFGMLAALLGPIGLIAAAVAPRDEDVLTERKLRDGRLRRCPRCAEAVKWEAAMCKHCGQAMVPVDMAPHTLFEKALFFFVGD